jgi:hypothetical protein
MATASDDNFDWVTAQAGCSAVQMFQKLQEGAEADVNRRNAAAPGRGDNWHFEFHDGDDGFEVVRIAASSKDGAAVSFALDGPRINIDGDGVDVRITAVVGINPAGECRYFVGELEYLGWEVRKQALDQLFFEDVEE